MKQFFTLKEIADGKLPGLPATVPGLHKLAVQNNWRADPARCRKASGTTKQAWEYHISLLPSAAQAKLLLLQSEPTTEQKKNDELWQRFDVLPDETKAVARTRLLVLDEITALQNAGVAKTAAVLSVCASHSLGKSAVYEWIAKVATYDRINWLPALAPATDRASEFAKCHPAAWAALKSDFLRPEKPTFSACYRRVSKLAKSSQWGSLPSERALRRRLDAEVAKSVQVLARDGADKAKTIYPAQRRIRTHLHAMQAVNMDGHRFDVFVRLPDGSTTRMYLIALQDLYSGKFVAFRLAESENKEAVRLVIGDMVERFGIPEKIVLDNGRAFASKWITGGAPNRYRFKVRDEDPRGLLVTLGVEITWTQPYSGQSKPIERAFRDLTDSIARHPACAGAYTGNRPDAKPENYASRAIDLDAFRQLVARQIAEHNAQPGRTAHACKGRSFDETFEASMKDPATLVRWPTEAQRSLWLLAAENIRAKKGSGEIHIYGNRYWAAALNAVAGQNVTVRFDPESLHRDIKVYATDGRFICDAECIADTGFDDVDAARIHAGKRNALLKSVREQKRLHAELTAEQLAALYAQHEKDLDVEPEPMRPGKVHRIATGNLAVDMHQQAQPVWDDQAEEDFSRGLRLFAGADNVIDFAPKSSEYGADRKPRSHAYGEKESGGSVARRDE